MAGKLASHPVPVVTVFSGVIKPTRNMLHQAWGELACQPRYSCMADKSVGLGSPFASWSSPRWGCLRIEAEKHPGCQHQRPKAKDAKLDVSMA